MNEHERESQVVQDTRDTDVIFIHSSVDDAGLTVAEFRVYGHLARRAGANGAYPGIDSMAKRCQLSRSSVIRSIQALEKRGMIRVKRVQGERNRYLLTRRTQWEEEPPVSEVDEWVTCLTETLGSVYEELGGVSNKERKVIQSKVIQSKVIQNLAESKKTSDHKAFVLKWCAGYREVFKEKYAFQPGKDGQAAKQLLAASGKTPDELMVIARAAWANGGGFSSKSAASLSGFNSKFNEIRQELNQTTNGKTNQRPVTESRRNVGTANEGRSAQYRGVGRLRRVPDAGRRGS